MFKCNFKVKNILSHSFLILRYYIRTGTMPRLMPQYSFFLNYTINFIGKYIYTHPHFTFKQFENQYYYHKVH